MRATALLLLAAAAVACTAADGAGERDHGTPLSIDVDFSTAACLDRFDFSDSSRWRWSKEDGIAAMELLGDSHYAPPVRSPTSIALLRGVDVADFELEVDVLQTGRDYGHRDLCLFFGFQAPTRFYYVHLAPAPDANAHNVFRVADAPRTNLAEIAANGVDWGEGRWHHVRIERRVANGSIEVYWDRSPRPILSATCRALDWGRIGFGSFDDCGRIRSLRLTASTSRAASDDNPFAVTR